MTGDDLFEVILTDSPQLRDGSPRSALLGAAIRRLIHDDETSIRVLQISGEIGMSPSVVYSNFGSRQGLVDAAYLQIFRSVTNASYATIDAIAATVDSAGAMAARWTPGAESEERLHRQSIRRRVRLRVVAASLTRRRLSREVNHERERYQQASTALFADLQRRSILPTSLSAKQLAVVHEGLNLIRAVDETMPSPLSADEWNEVKAVLFGLKPLPPSP